MADEKRLFRKSYNGKVVPYTVITASGIKYEAEMVGRLDDGSPDDIIVFKIGKTKVENTPALPSKEVLARLVAEQVNLAISKYTEPKKETE